MKASLKKSRLERDSNPWPLRHWCSARPVELSNPMGECKFLTFEWSGNELVRNWYSEAWLRSGELSDYLGFLAGDFCHSTSVSPSDGFLFFFFILLWKGSVGNVWYLFLEVQCHRIRWRTRFHLFSPQIRNGFLVIFRIWRGTLTFNFIVYCLDLVLYIGSILLLSLFPHAALVTIRWLTALSQWTISFFIPRHSGVRTGHFYEFLRYVCGVWGHVMFRS